MRVVLDTNVIVSAFLWQKGLKPIYEAVRAGRITPCLTEATLDELRHTLSYERFNDQMTVTGMFPNQIVKLLTGKALLFPRVASPDIVKDDPSDNAILACAETARASCIVTGDRHLLALTQYRNISILTPRQFLVTSLILLKRNNTANNAR